MRYVEDATCRPVTDVASRCTCTPEVTREEPAGSAEGTWYVSVPATAEDGGTAFVPRAAAFGLTP